MIIEPDKPKARARLEQSMAACNLVARACCLAVAALTARTDMANVRRRWVPGLATGVFAAEAVSVARRVLGRRTAYDGTSAALDVSTSLFALLAEGVAHGQRRRPGGPRFGIDYAAGSLTFASSEEPSGRRLAVSALTIASAYWLLVDGPLSAKLNDLAIVTSGVALQPILAQYRHQADMVDIARDRSVHEAAALAVARERRQSQRALHDAALQILEAVSGGWAPDDELLLSQIDFELMRLRDELALAAPRASAALVEHLDRLAALLKRTGLEVELDTSQLGEPRLADDALAALSGALAEACTNVRKHANATLVTLTASSTQGRVVVSARDNGIGFDISAGQGGFGIRESILARVRSVGGDAVVAPSRQRGTRVTAWVPL